MEMRRIVKKEVTVNGPDGATHLILRTGVAKLGSGSHETYTFLAGPQISRGQFVEAIASGALSKIQTHDKDHMGGNSDVEVGAKPVLINANYDAQSGQLKVRDEVSSRIRITKLAISYNVSILA